jgi:multicomponent K+:H+ antiporter subunit G
MTAFAAVLVFLGAVVVFIGSLGLLRLPTFFERVHPSTMGSTVGMALVLAGSMLHFAAVESRFGLHEILIGAFLTFGVPVTYVLLGRAALKRGHQD